MSNASLRPALLFTLLAYGGFIGTSCAVAGDAPPQVSMTRSMAVFADLERTLSEALASQDQAATDRLVAQDFELRPAAHPGEATTRADWIADGSLRGKGTNQISVRDLGDVAVASFVMAMDDGSSSYVVDVWSKQGEAWQLLSRYQSDVPAADAPGEDIAPTGKG